MNKSYLHFTICVFAISIFAKNYSNSLKNDNCNILKENNYTKLDFKIILGSHLNYLQNNRIKESFKNKTNTTNYLFIGNLNEQKSFKLYINSVKSYNYNYSIIKIDSQNTAEHILCILFHFMTKYNYTDISNINKGILKFKFPKTILYTNDFHKERFIRTYNIILYELRNKGLFINSSNINIKDISTPKYHKDWLIKAEKDIHNKNIMNDIKKASNKYCGFKLFNFLIK